MTYRIVPTTGKAIIEVDGTEVLELGADQSVKIRGEFNPTKLLVNGKRVASQGRRNVVVNGNCEIVQDVASRVFNSNGTFYGGPDMFRGNFQNATVGQFTQSQGSLTFNGVAKKTIRQTVNTGSNDFGTNKFWGGLETLVEGFNSFSLQGKKVAVSFIFNSNVSGVYPVSIRCYGAGTGGAYYLTSFSYTAGAPKKVEFTTTSEMPLGAIDFLTNGQIEFHVGFRNDGDFVSNTLDTWVTGTTTGISTADSVNWGATAGNFIELTELQIEADQVTEFEYESFGENLSRCQRYYEKSYDIGTPPGTVTVNGRFLTPYSTSGLDDKGYIEIEYKVTKRAAPTITTYTDGGSPIVGNLTAQRHGLASAFNVAVNSANGSVSQAQLRLLVGVLNTSGFAYGHWVADARL